MLFYVNDIPGKTKVKIEYIRGIVTTEIVDEIIAILAPGSGSPPYASGNIIVFIPRGIAVAKKVKYTTLRSTSILNKDIARCLMRATAEIKIAGKIKRRKNVAT